MTSLRSDALTASHYTSADGFPVSLAMQEGNDYAAALFTHSARLYPFAPSYLQSQLAELLGPGRRSQLNQLALSCMLLARHVRAGKNPQAALALLAAHPQYEHAAEFIARALINTVYLQQKRHQIAHLNSAEAAAEIDTWSLPFALHDEIRPMPASLIRALLQWPDNDKLFTKALLILHKQPALASLVCRYATAYTPQGKQLELKPSLLLLGPQRSRELVLLAHFESNLSKPVFPLRHSILKRRMLIQHTLSRLAEEFSVALPCRAELIAYLMVYDAWRSPGWTTRSRLQADPSQPLWRVDSWVTHCKPANHRVALRLCRYWRMPAALSDAIQLQHSDGRINALMALSVASVYVISKTHNIHPGNDGHHDLQSELNIWLGALSANGNKPVFTRYLEVVARAATDAAYSSDLPCSMRP